MKLILIPHKTKVASIASIFLIAVNFLLPKMLNAQPGTLDNTFDNDGILTTNFGNSYNYAYSLAIQTDGKIVVAGNAWNGLEYDFAVARYNIDGSLDNTFDGDGKLTTDFGGTVDKAWSVAIQTNGKILVAGYSTIGISSDFALARYNNDGSLDNTFDMDGKLTTDFASMGDFGNSVAIQADGKIVVAGNSFNGSNADFALVRYNSDGSLDITFDNDGKLTTDFAGEDDGGTSIALQPDGKILLAGFSYTGFNNDFALVRYNSDGSLDTSFATDGKLTTFIGANNDRGHSVVIQSDGKIVIAGYSDIGSYNDFSLVRYNSDGSLDNTFDTDGKLTTDFGGSYDKGYSVALQNDGKIVVAGSSYNGSNFDFALARYNTDGSLDITFDSDGKITTDIVTASTHDDGTSVAIQNDGKIVVAGYTSYAPNDDFAVVRYNGDLVGIESESANNTISVYPNPTPGMVQVSWDAQEQFNVISLIDIAGKKLKEELIYHTNFINLDLSNAPAGIYFVEIKSTNNTIFKKVIKE